MPTYKIKGDVKNIIILSKESLPIRYVFNDQTYDLKYTQKGGLILNRAENDENIKALNTPENVQ